MKLPFKLEVSEALLIVAAFIYMLVVAVPEPPIKGKPILPEPAPVPTSTATRTSTNTPTIAPTGTSIPSVALPMFSLYLNLYFNHPLNPFMAKPEAYKVSDEGVEFVAAHEGFFSSRYNDGLPMTDPLFYDTTGRGTGNCTIGYGNLLHMGPCNGSESVTSVSKTSAQKLLRVQLDHCGAYVVKYVNVRITQHQYDIMAGLVCGTGYENFAKSKFLKTLNQNLYFEAAEALKSTAIYGVGGSGGPYPGLVKRRAQEAVIFLIPTR